MNSEEYIKKARSLRGNGKNLDHFQEAVSLLREGSKKFPNDFRLQFQFGNYCRELSRKILNEAAKTLRKVTKKSPDGQLKVKALSELGLVEQWLTNFKQSEAALNKAIELKPGNKPSYTVLANTYKLAGQFAQGIAIIERALRIDPNNKRFQKLALELEKQEQAIIDSAMIRKLISKAQTLEALDHLEKYFITKGDSEGLNEISLMKAQLTKVENEIRIGIISKSDSDVIIARINNSILNLMKRL